MLTFEELKTNPQARFVNRNNNKTFRVAGCFTDPETGVENVALVRIHNMFQDKSWLSYANFAKTYDLLDSNPKGESQSTVKQNVISKTVFGEAAKK